MSKKRIIDLQRQVRIARLALTKIAAGSGVRAESIADNALDEMRPLDEKQPLQGVVGHAVRREHEH